MPFACAGIRGSRTHATMLRSIVRLGFRRWYERKLIEGHAWLAACFLSMVIVAAGIELLGERASRAEFLLDAAIVSTGAALGWFAWKRYSALMLLAGILAEQAVCPACDRFGFRCDPAQSSAPCIPKNHRENCRGRAARARLAPTTSQPSRTR